jgi:tRNA threonylcarbamoyladenosine biosynthesis protein TsaB
MNDPCLLAFDASVEPGSCALFRDGAALGRRAAAGTTSSQTLLPLAGELLAGEGLGLQSVHAIAFGCGPGAFTGLRVACGIAQGLAFGLRLPVVPVDSLAAVALQAIDRHPDAAEILVCCDARMGEVYCARYRNAQGWPQRLGEPAVLPPAAVAAAFDDGTPAAQRLVAGNALLAYPALAERFAAAQALLPELLPLAEAVVRLAVPLFRQTGGLAPELAAPTYVRDRVALTVAERLAAGGRA